MNKIQSEKDKVIYDIHKRINALKERELIKCKARHSLIDLCIVHAGDLWYITHNGVIISNKINTSISYWRTK